jgi:TrmH family RNA methyltransferase
MPIPNKTRIVLVETSLSGNVGSAARAMKTMGLSDLVLVSPRDYQKQDAMARASGADDLLDSLRIVDSLDEAIEDCQLIVGTSARSRANPWPVIEPRELASKIDSQNPSGTTALVFGRERSGLTNEELARCHYHVHIPSNPDYSSLNLAAAVQVLSYEIRVAALAQQDPPQEENEEALASSGQLEGFFEHLQNTLVETEFLDPENPRLLMQKLRRLYMRAQLEENEVNILRGILSQTQKYGRKQ